MATPGLEVLSGKTCGIKPKPNQSCESKQNSHTGLVEDLVNNDRLWCCCSTQTNGPSVGRLKRGGKCDCSRERRGQTGVKDFRIVYIGT